MIRGSDRRARAFGHLRLISWANERGSSGISTFWAVLLLIMLLGLGVFGMRTFIASGHVSQASRAGARAASYEYDAAQAEAAAIAAVADELDDSDACDAYDVGVTGDYEPGGIVEVTVVCTVPLAGLLLPDSIGDVEVRSVAIEAVDVVRGRNP